MSKPEPPTWLLVVRLVTSSISAVLVLAAAIVIIRLLGGV